MRVLIVEDEVRLAENIAAALREGPGYAVDAVHDGKDAMQLCGHSDYDLIILDLMLPGARGEEVLQAVRKTRSQSPILILTAISETERTVDLLNRGADDYLTKPFDLGELIARARALVRRGQGTRASLLICGQLRMHTSEQTVEVQGRRVDLSPTEYRILEYMMYRPRAIVSKRELLEHLYDFTWEHHSNVIEAHMSNLRKKLRSTLEDDALETLRGRGYRLAER